MTLFDDLDGYEEPKPKEPTPFDRGMSGSEAAARKWTDEQSAAVDAAIAGVAAVFDTFTADEVWHVLGPDFPVTKGLASRLKVAANRGLIVSTGELRVSSRGGAHDHAQRLTVWRSRVREEEGNR